MLAEMEAKRARQAAEAEAEERLQEELQKAQDAARTAQEAAVAKARAEWRREIESVMERMQRVQEEKEDAEAEAARLRGQLEEVEDLAFEAQRANKSLRALGGALRLRLALLFMGCVSYVEDRVRRLQERYEARLEEVQSDATADVEQLEVQLGVSETRKSQLESLKVSPAVAGGPPAGGLCGTDAAFPGRCGRRPR